MNIDLDKLGRMTESDLDDKKERKRLVQYLYQLSEQLKYWQFNLEEENFSAELQALMKKVELMAAALVKENAESGESIVIPTETPSEVAGADVTVAGDNSVTITGGNQVTAVSGGDMALSAEEMVITGYQLLQLMASQVLKIDGYDESSFIRLAYSSSGPKFLVNGEGTLTAKETHLESLYVGGRGLEAIIEAHKDNRLQVSYDQPEGTDIVWVKPQEAPWEERTTIFTGSGSSMMNNETCERTFTMTRDSGGFIALSGVTNRLTFQIYNPDQRCTVLTVGVSITGSVNGGGSATISESWMVGETIAIGGYYTFDETLDGTTNLTYGSSVSVTVTVQFDIGAERTLMSSGAELTCTGEVPGEYSSSEPIQCDVFYIPASSE